jgi:hypothetical protein
MTFATLVLLPVLFQALPEPEAPMLRVNVDAMPLGISVLHRQRGAPGSVAALHGGVDVHVFPDAMHGFMLGVGASGAVFGPSVMAFDVGYSLRLGEQGHHQGVTADFVATFAPSLAMVNFPGDSFGQAPSSHATLGARVSAVGHLYFWKIALGLQVAYRGGAALRGNSGYNGMFSVGPTIGFVIDP